MNGARARKGVEIGQAGEVALVIEALDGDAFRRLPGLACPASPGRGSGFCQAMLGEIGDHCGRADRLVDAQRLAAARRTRAPSSATGRRSAASVVTGRSDFRRIERRADDLPLAVAVVPGRACCAASTIRDWILPATRLSRMPPSASIRRNSSHAASHSDCGQRLDAAGTGGRIGDEIDMALLGQDQLRVAGDAPREGVRQAVRDAVRQDRDRIGAAGRRREAGDRGAQDVGFGVLRRHHAVGCLDMDRARGRRDRAGLLRRAPTAGAARCSLAIDRNWS